MKFGDFTQPLPEHDILPPDYYEHDRTYYCPQGVRQDVYWKTIKGEHLMGQPDDLMDEAREVGREQRESGALSNNTDDEYCEICKIWMTQDNLCKHLEDLT